MICLEPDRKEGVHKEKPSFQDSPPPPTAFSLWQVCEAGSLLARVCPCLQAQQAVLSTLTSHGSREGKGLLPVLGCGQNCLRVMIHSLPLTLPFCGLDVISTFPEWRVFGALSVENPTVSSVR